MMEITRCGHALKISWWFFRPDGGGVLSLWSYPSSNSNLTSVLWHPRSAGTWKEVTIDPMVRGCHRPLPNLNPTGGLMGGLTIGPSMEPIPYDPHTSSRHPMPYVHLSTYRLSACLYSDTSMVAVRRPDLTPFNFTSTIVLLWSFLSFLQRSLYRIW